MSVLGTLALTLAVSAGSNTVLLDFYGDTCPPCRQMAPVVQQLAAKGYPVRQINVDREPQLAARFGVQSIPCFVMIVDGKEVDRAVGITSLNRLERMCALGQPGRSPDPPVAVQMVSNGPTKSPSVVIPAVRSGPAFSPAAPQNGLAASPASAPAVQRPEAAVPGWRLTSPDWASGDAPEKTYANLVAATVRLRIADGTGHSCGSGTIIDSRQGQALVLTCGHLFRDSQGRGRIEVDLFGSTPAEKVPGELVWYSAPTRGDDPRPDLGLIKIRVPGPVAVARVAPAGHQVAKGARVVSVGCNNGDRPTARLSQVTSQDKFLGAPNIEASGLPVQGRSGGGLFSAEGYLIGVCNAAVPSDNEGLYASLNSIHVELDKIELGFVYRETPSPTSESTLVAGSPAMPRQMPPPSDLVQLTEATGPAINPAMMPAGANPGAPLSDQERATLQELQRRKSEGAEVICIIRPRGNASAKSDIIVIDKATPAFLQGLTSGPRDSQSYQSRDGVIPASHAAPIPQGNPDSRQAPLVPVNRTFPAIGEGASAGTDWQPRWLQSGYQGS